MSALKVNEPEATLDTYFENLALDAARFSNRARALLTTTKTLNSMNVPLTTGELAAQVHTVCQSRFVAMTMLQSMLSSLVNYLNDPMGDKTVGSLAERSLVLALENSVLADAATNEAMELLSQAVQHQNFVRYHKENKDG